MTSAPADPATFPDPKEAEVSEDKREVFGWQMYDWAWSAFSTTVTTALLGPYLLELAEDNGGVEVLGFDVEPASFFPFCVSLSAIIQVLLLPLVGSIADHTDRKKRLMMTLAYAASAATAGLFLVTGTTILVGGLLFIIAGIGFSAASVVYNSYLPDIAPPHRRDRVSSAGFAYGYLGGGLWLAANFALITLMDDTGLAVRISLGGTGIWCLVFFAAFPERLIRTRPASRPRPPNTGWLGLSFRSVFTTLAEMRRQYPITLRYLVAYLIFNDGIQTVIVVSTSFAKDELPGVEAEDLLLLVLMIQFVAVPGAILFGRLAERYGAKQALAANLCVWVGLVVFAYVFLRSLSQLWMMGVVLAVVLGGSQALSRSLYAQMIPTNSEAEYFGFYEIAARGTSWIGPLVFGVVNQITGSQRQAILSLIVFFVVGLILLLPVRVRDAMVAAGHDPEGVVH
ncbi:MAG: UMF1 family MFS transporter [Acidimicrobiales bacterium]